MKITNNNGLPQPFVEAVQASQYEPDEDRIGVTSLIGPPQIRVLKLKHWREIEEDASGRVWALFGSAVHHILEQASAESEVRLIDGRHWKLNLVGVLDLLEKDDDGKYTITDYKTTSTWSVLDGIKPDWEIQLNLYAYLCEYYCRPVKALKVVCIFRDWSKGKTAKTDYPQAPVIEYDVPMWTRAERMEYINERMALHLEAMEGEIPECTLDEKWQDLDKYAVMKNGRKRALRVLDSEGAAAAWMDENGGDTIEHRPSTPRRCESYCSVKNFCKQYQKEVQDV